MLATNITSGMKSTSTLCTEVDIVEPPTKMIYSRDPKVIKRNNNTSTKLLERYWLCQSSFSLPPVKRNDRSEAACTPEMPANLWAPASGGEHGGAFGTHRESFSHCPRCHLWLPIIVSNLWLTYGGFGDSPALLRVWILLNIVVQWNNLKRELLVISIWFFHCRLKPRTAFMRFISRLDVGAGQQKEDRGPIMRDGGRIKQKGSYGLASIHRRICSRVFMAHKSTSSSCPCLDWSSLWLGDSNQYFQLAFDSICSLSGWGGIYYENVRCKGGAK